jgi:Fe2+ or Zn2+ uptake regulation protein
LTDTDTTILRERGYRMTPQRLVILRILHEAGGHLTPLEVYQRAQREMPGLTEATIYRTLIFLSQQGLLLAAHVGSGQLVYETAGHAHHHLICRKCGETQEIDHTLLEALYQQFRASTGYRIDGMHVTFFGLCPGCQEIELPIQNLD